MTVHLYTVCWNEADMLGFFFGHYDSWVDRYVIYDDGSTDESLDVLRAHPKVDLRSFDQLHRDSFALSHVALQNEAWKASRGVADWVVVTAIDEHLLVHAKAMSDYLRSCRSEGVTVIPALGFDMNSEAFPAEGELLSELVRRGRPRRAFNKLSIFDPGAVTETGFAIGRHSAAPRGTIRFPVRDELMLWHYKHLGFERNQQRENAQAARLRAIDIQKGFGRHYLWSNEQRLDFWSEMRATSVEISRADFEPSACCEQPLWWRPEQSRSVQALGSESKRPQPKVSVVVKAYNHAPYVRQTIQSVLDQSFQDFEIVVTDDASSDETLSILRSFSDPRIRLQGMDRNHGISAAMNATVQRADGEYVAILNSDDWALPDRLRKQVEFLDRTPDVAAVFGLPRTVDEQGLSTGSFNDFGRPLSLSDYSRQTWLRHFFFHGNCLCAPTAMIRRSVFENIGYYDPRLTNLQDFDFWIRMLVAGLNIHILDEELTAFRIRAGARNMSAPRPDSVLRDELETNRVLQHYKRLDKTTVCEVFAADITECAIDTGRSVLAILAELALTRPRSVYQLFALDALSEGAAALEEFAELRHLTGSLNIFRLQAAPLEDDCLSNRLIAAQQEMYAVQALRQQIAITRTAEASRTAAQTECEALRHQLRHQSALTKEAEASHAAAQNECDLSRRMLQARHLEKELLKTEIFLLRSSRSWRLTHPLRLLSSLVKAGLRHR